MSSAEHQRTHLQAIYSVQEGLPSAIHYPTGHNGWTFGPMAGRSPVMQRLFSQMRHTARHLRITTLEGESGTGK
jgi:DNA-binding NtrC family response regulator